MNAQKFDLKKIIFLSYVNRSGSTFLANTFSKSNDIMVLPEAEILVNLLLVQPDLKFNLIDEVRIQIKTNAKLKLWGLNSADLSVLHNVETNFEAFVEVLQAYKNKFKPEARVLMFKAERLIYLYETIYKQFKQKYCLSMVVLVRDPRAIYASQKKTKMPYCGTQMSQNPVFTAIYWNNFVSVLNTIESRKDVFAIKYEDLILKYQETFNNSRILLHISEFDFSSKGDLWDRIPKVQRSIHTLIEKYPQRERVSNWENELNENEKYLIERCSNKGMIFFNYQPGVILNRRFFKRDLVGAIYWAKYYIRRIINKVLFRVYKREI